MKVYDLIVIGGGPAGYLAAERAANADLEVLLFEKENLGGVCLNRGCIPSKALLQCAKVFENAKDGSEFGVSSNDAKIDQQFVIRRKNRIVKKLVVGVRGKMRRAGVTVINDSAFIEGKTDDLFSISDSEQSYSAKNVLLATGSNTFIPNITGVSQGIDSGKVLTSTEILNLTEIPEQLVVIGGGVIGLEMASYYNSVGTKVTVIEMMDNIGGELDLSIAKRLQQSYEKKGVEFLLGAKVIEITENSVRYQQQQETLELSADTILMSVGRKPNTDNLGLENIGVELKNSAVVTDHMCCTNVENFYAAGDVNGKSLLAHTAYREAEVAVAQILGKLDSINYKAVPSVIYTSPEAASVGETEQSALKKGYNIKVSELPMTYSGRYMAEDERGNGICKIILETDTNKLLGMHLLGIYSSEIIYGASMMLDQQIDIEQIKKTVFPHPSVSEIIKETLFEFE